MTEETWYEHREGRWITAVYVFDQDAGDYRWHEIPEGGYERGYE